MAATSCLIMFSSTQSDIVGQGILGGGAGGEEGGGGGIGGFKFAPNFN